MRRVLDWKCSRISILKVEADPQGLYAVGPDKFEDDLVEE
jgi:hypothetical protein